jgi:hypothetical protein
MSRDDLDDVNELREKFKNTPIQYKGPPKHEHVTSITVKQAG